MQVSVSFWILALLLITRDVNTIRKSGPFNMVPTRFDSCNDVGTDEVHFGLKMSSKGNGVLLYSGDVIFKVPWDDKLKITVEVQQLNNGAYTPKFVAMTFDNCEKYWEYGKDILPSFFGAAGYNFTKCPLPAGTYSVKEWPFVMNFKQLPSFFYGSYKMILEYFYDEKRVGCLNMYTEVVPIKS